MLETGQLLPLSFLGRDFTVVVIDPGWTWGRKARCRDRSTRDESAYQYAGQYLGA